MQRILVDTDQSMWLPKQCGCEVAHIEFVLLNSTLANPARNVVFSFRYPFGKGDSQTDNLFRGHAR